MHAHNNLNTTKTHTKRINMSSKLVWEELKHSVPKIKYKLETLGKQQRLRHRQMKRQSQREKGVLQR